MGTVFALILTSIFGAAQAQLTPPLPAEMKAIDVLFGERAGTMKMTMPGSTEPMDVPTIVSCKTYGLYQDTTYTMDMGAMGKFSGYMFLTWNAADKCYKSWGFDSNVNEPRTEKGTWDGKKLVLVSDPQGGMITRITFEPKSTNEVFLLLKMKNGEKFDKMGEVVYKRK